MILSLYFTRRFLTMFALVVAVFSGILLMIDVIDQLRQTNIALSRAMHLSLLNMPESLYQILPLIIILTAISLFIGLARSSELVVVRAAGRSGIIFLMAPVIVAFMIGAVGVAVFDPLVAATSKAYERLKSQDINDISVLSITEDGLWMRQGTDNDQSVINARRTNADGSALQDVTLLTFDKQGIPTRRIEAASADLQAGAWVLQKVKLWDLQADIPEQTATLQDQLTVPTDLTLKRIKEGFGTPSSVAFWSLPAYIAGLERAGFSARSYQVWFQMELALPLLLAAMVLIAAGFTMRHARFGKTGQMVLLALLCGFLIFFLRNFAQVLGVNGQIPVFLAAWAPPVAATLFALGLLLHLEDG
jgi:lipopolysaccharide export system permease protein